jgi:hypothetical protein
MRRLASRVSFVLAFVASLVAACSRKDEGTTIRSDPGAKPSTQESATVTAEAFDAATSAAPSAPSSKGDALKKELEALEMAALAELSADAGGDGGLKFGDAGGGGGLAGIGGSGATPSDASAVIARHRFRFRACLTKEIAKDPKTTGGKVVVKVEVAANGEVKSAVPTSTTASKDLTDCVVHAFHSMVFAASDAGTTSLQVPISLVPGS